MAGNVKFNVRHLGMLVALALTVAACGTGAPTDAPTAAPTSAAAPTAPGTPSARTQLTVRGLPARPVNGGTGEPGGRQWTLRCEPVGGNHPNAKAACDALATAGEWWKPVPANAICTQIYGGPEVATIQGTWRGMRVNATFKRTDGCQIERWERIAPVLAPAGSVT